MFGQAGEESGRTRLDGMPKKLACLENTIVRDGRRSNLRRGKHWFLNQNKPLLDGGSRLADGAMIVIMMLVLALFMENRCRRIIAAFIFSHAKAMLRTHLFHLVLMHKWKKPC